MAKSRTGGGSVRRTEKSPKLALADVTWYYMCPEDMLVSGNSDAPERVELLCNGTRFNLTVPRTPHENGPTT